MDGSAWWVQLCNISSGCRLLGSFFLQFSPLESPGVFPGLLPDPLPHISLESFSIPKWPLHHFVTGLCKAHLIPLWLVHMYPSLDNKCHHHWCSLPAPLEGSAQFVTLTVTKRLFTHEAFLYYGKVALNFVVVLILLLDHSLFPVKLNPWYGERDIIFQEYFSVVSLFPYASAGSPWFLTQNIVELQTMVISWLFLSEA